MARFALSNDSDHSAIAWIVAFLTLIYTTLTLLLRIWVKVRMIGIDDLLAVLSQLLAYGSIGSVIYGLDKGFAKDVRRRSEEVSQDVAKVSQSAHQDVAAADRLILQAVKASQVFFLLALAAAKVTMILFLQRIFERSNHGKAILLCNVAIGLVSLWGVGATIAVSVGCSPGHVWLPGPDDSCAGAVSVSRLMLDDR